MTSKLAQRAASSGVSLQDPNWSMRQFDANLRRPTYLPWLKCGRGQLWILSLGGTSDRFVERVKKCGCLLLDLPAILPPASPSTLCLLSHRMRPVAKGHTVMSYMHLFIGLEQQKVLVLNSHFDCREWHPFHFSPGLSCPCCKDSCAFQTGVYFNQQYRCFCSGARFH